MHRKIFLPLAGLLFCSQVSALELSGLSQPESVAVDPKTGDVYVSNVNGPLLEKDSNGYVTKVSADGLIVVLKFAESKPGVYELHAPRGLAVGGGGLYVVDIDSVKLFRLEDGSLIHSVDLAPIGAQFPSDVALSADGTVFVSDMLANRIYRIDPKDGYKLTIYKEGEELGQPNGLLFDPFTKNLMVAGFQSGSLMEIDKKGRIRTLKAGLAGLDGIAADRDGNIYVSSFTKGEIYRISKWGRGPLTLFQTGLEDPADICYDPVRRILRTPLMRANSVTYFPVMEKRGRTSAKDSSRKSGRAGS